MPDTTNFLTSEMLNNETVALVGPGTLSTPYYLDINNYVGGFFGFFNYDGSNIDEIYTPFASSNKATRYETWVVATVGSSKFVKF